MGVEERLDRIEALLQHIKDAMARPTEAVYTPAELEAFIEKPPLNERSIPSPYNDSIKKNVNNSLAYEPSGIITLAVVLPHKEDILKEAEKQISDWLEGSTENEKEHYRVAFRRSYEYIVKKGRVG